MRRSLSAALLTVLVAASTAACGITGITTQAKSVTARTVTIALPLDGLSANQILEMSLADLKATSVHYAGTTSDSGHPITITVTEAKGVDCAGSFQEPGQGSVQMVVEGKVAWMKGDDAFWTGLGATGATMNTLADNYIKITKSSIVSQFAPLCDAAPVASVMGTKPAGLTVTKTTMYNRAVVELKETAKSATMVVSDTSTPEILQVSRPGSGGGSFTFSNFGQPATIAPPPDDMTLDGAQFGM